METNAEVPFLNNADPSAHKPADVPLFDLRNLMQLEEPDTIRMVFQMFETSVPGGLEDLKQQAMSENWQAVFAQAHKLKSGFGIIQITDLLEKLTIIEFNAKERKGLQDILPMISHVIQTFHQVLPIIKTQLEKETSKPS